MLRFCQIAVLPNGNVKKTHETGPQSAYVDFDNLLTKICIKNELKKFNLLFQVNGKKIGINFLSICFTAPNVRMH